MLACPGEGCKFRAKNDRSLSTHVRQCPKAAIGLASVAERVEQHEADQRQAKRRRVSSAEPLEVVTEAEEAMDVDSEVSLTDDAPENRCLITIILSE